MLNNTIVLAYHSIRDVDEGSIYRSLSVSPTLFKAQLLYLIRKGYRNVPAKDLDEHPLSRRKRFVITFDDGFEDNYTHALPIMRDLGCTGLVFLTTGLLQDSHAAIQPGVERLPYLSWDMIREMEKHGFEFGSHQINHKRLSKMDEEEMKMEIIGSKTLIEEQLKHEIRYFSAPFGDFPLSAYPLVHENYSLSFLTYAYKSPYKHHRDVISRVGVYGQNTLLQFKLKVQRDRFRLL